MEKRRDVQGGDRIVLSIWYLNDHSTYVLLKQLNNIDFVIVQTIYGDQLQLKDAIFIRLVRYL